MKERTYLAIDLKSFFASAECVERGLNPLDTNLVVADESRTEKTICLAVTPSLKAYGLSGRSRLFEVVQTAQNVNRQRKMKNYGRKLTGESCSAAELKANSALALSYIVAPPRMALYTEYSTRIYSIYLQYVAPEDMHIYSIDEVFMDVTDYLPLYRMTPRELAMTIIEDVLRNTGITATAGIGTNLYLCKIAMDIMAKKMRPGKNGVRIAQLDEMGYRRALWSHTPLTDFWRVGAGTAKKLMENGMYTMGDVARCSLGKPHEIHNEDLLYKLFGVNAELLIDHAWGWEPCTMADIRAYRPEEKSLSSGQVLHCPYPYEKTKIIVREMAEAMALELVAKNLVTNQVVLTIGYDTDNLKKQAYRGSVTTDRYGRKVPKHAHGTENLSCYTASGKLITDSTLALFERIINRDLLVRRVTIPVSHLQAADEVCNEPPHKQLDLFTDYTVQAAEAAALNAHLEKEKSLQQTMLTIKEKYGKNAILKGTNLQEGATGQSRNRQIGGHKA